MSESFSQLLGHWQTFYYTLAGVAATLTGLVFVAVSLRLPQIMNAERPELRLLAVQTFSNFIFVLLCALYFLIPWDAIGELAITLLLTTIGGIVALAVQGPEGLQAARRAWRRHYIFWRVTIPALCYLWVAGLAVALALGNSGLLSWIVPAFLLLLGTSARNAWDLLMRVGEEPPADDGDSQLRRVERQLREVTRRQRQITRQQEEAGRQAGVLPPRRRG